MHQTEKKKLVRDFLVTQKLGVLATLHPNGNPEAAVIQVSPTDNLEIIFDCLPHTRKRTNLDANHHIALVIGWDENITVQIEGIAEPVARQEIENAKAIHTAHNPTENEFLKQGAILYKIKPKLIKYSDFRIDPAIALELMGEELTIS